MSKLSEAFSPQVFTAASFILSTVSLFISGTIASILKSQEKERKEEQEHTECWDCVFSKTVDAKECFCKVDSSFPYLSTVNGKPMKHPAWGCQYFIRKHAGNRNLDFSVKLKTFDEATK